MRLDQSTWREVETYLANNSGIFLPVGSTEQHGPIGLIGTDAICAQTIAEGAADQLGALVAPTLAYTPAPFNTAFPGTLSISEGVFRQLFSEIIGGLQNQGFTQIYVLNGHGANLTPMTTVASQFGGIRIQSWWDFDAVNHLRAEMFGDWEGMHATPSEISITQTIYRSIESDDARMPPRKLTKAEITDRAGDRHGPADLHRREFPDGRVGSHSALATPVFGRRLLRAAVESVKRDFVRLTT